MTDTKEKTTSPGSSVGADGEPSPFKNYDLSIPETKKKDNVPKKKAAAAKATALKTVTVTTLLDTLYPPLEPIIHDLLYPGTYLFAGAPKVGKSFMMAQLAYHTSSGIPLWEHPVNPGTALYLALEDNNRRMQQRLYKMFGARNNDKFYLATAAHRMNQGLEEQLEKFLEEHPDTKLIIYDTMQKVRGKDGDDMSYKKDYEMISQIKAFGDQYDLCQTIVHHTRKQEASDRFDTISGTNGLLGAADGAFILEKKKRGSNKAIMEMVSRDLPDQKFHLSFDTQKCLWQLEELEKESFTEPVNPLLEAVNQFLEREGKSWHGRASDLVNLLDIEKMSPNMLTKNLNPEVGRLSTEYGIEYENKRSNRGSDITLVKK